MTKSVGAIKYTVEAETGDLLNAEKMVDKATEKMRQDFNKVDTAVKNTGKEFDRASSKVHASGSKMTKSAKAVKTGMNGMGRGAGQAGIQIQQFVGQVQGGQSAMLALSQQGADLGIVLGLPLAGAIIGIGASIIGFLIPSLGKATDKFAELNSAANELTGNFELLNEEQKKLAGALLANNLVEQQNELTKTEKSVSSLRAEFLATQRNFKNAKGNILNAFVDKDDVKEARTALLDGQALLIKQQGELAKTKKSIADLNVDSIKQIKIDKEKVDTVKKIVDGVRIQADLYGASARAISLYAAATAGATAEDLAAISAAHDKIDAIKKTDEAEKNKAKLTGQVQGLGVSPEDQIRMRLDKELELLRLAQEQKIEIEGTYQERRIELQAQADEKIAGLNKKTAEESIFNYEALENQIVGTFASIATGAQDGKEAIRGLAQAVLTQMIGSLVKLGIQAMIGQTATTAATSASMGVIATAAAPAAALVSLATSGANSPLAIAGMASAGTAASGIALAGGRQFGGGVSGGNAYRMGEDGPEILKQGNKNIVIPGENGQVISNKDLGGGGGTTININNMASGVEVQATPSNDGRTIDIAVRRAVAEITNQVATGNGKFMNALKSNTNMTSKATR